MKQYEKKLIKMRRYYHILSVGVVFTQTQMRLTNSFNPPNWFPNGCRFCHLSLGRGVFSALESTAIWAGIHICDRGKSSAELIDLKYALSEDLSPLRRFIEHFLQLILSPLCSHYFLSHPPRERNDQKGSAKSFRKFSVNAANAVWGFGDCTRPNVAAACHKLHHHGKENIWLSSKCTL